MAESTTIPVFVTALALEDTIEICSEYIGVEVDCGEGETFTELPNIQIANYYGVDGNLNSIPFVEGDLMIAGVNIPLENDIWLNNQGELIVKGDDNAGYYIDDDGYLIYDYCVLACLDEYYECGYVEDDYVN